MERNQKEKQLHEVNAYKDKAFPVGLYTVTRDSIEPAGRGYMDLHWHEELQLTYVVNGQMDIQVSGITYHLCKGQAIFINRNLLHATTYLTEDGKYQSLDFPEKLLGFFPGSRMEQDDVLPYTGNAAFPAMVFSPETVWQRELLQKLKHTLDDLRHPKGKEYEISCALTKMWQILIRHVDLSKEQPSLSNIRMMKRMQNMIAYIHANYQKKIRIADIAAAGNISEGECNRSFRKLVQKSPAQYVLFYRICQSMTRLREGSDSITQVALACGFNDTSYFIRCFKQQTGITPKMYQSGKMSE